MAGRGYRRNLKLLLSLSRGLEIGRCGLNDEATRNENERTKEEEPQTNWDGKDWAGKEREDGNHVMG